MKKLYAHFSFLLLACTMMFLSCEKFEAPQGEDADTVVKEEDTDNGDSEEHEPPVSMTYSVSDIINGKFSNREDVYVVGYIVGYVKSSSMDFCRFSRGNVETNIIIADTPVDTFANKCIPVQLTTANIACKATRTALNLAKNDVLGQKVVLQGDIDSYMGVDYGILKARNHTFLENDYNGEEGDKDNAEESSEDENSDNTNGEEKKEEDQPTQEEQEWAELVEYIHSHGNTEDAPFTITDFKTTLLKYLNSYGDSVAGHAGMNDVYICGYIVGYIPKGYSKMEKTVFGTEHAPQTNIVLADSPEEQDYNNCIPVQLSTNSDRHKEVRNALNLADHPENYKKRFIIFGNISFENGYMGTRGLISTREYIPCDDE